VPIKEGDATSKSKSREVHAPIAIALAIWIFGGRAYSEAEVRPIVAGLLSDAAMTFILLVFGSAFRNGRVSSRVLAATVGMPVTRHPRTKPYGYISAHIRCASRNGPTAQY